MSKKDLNKQILKDRKKIINSYFRTYNERMANVIGSVETINAMLKRDIELHEWFELTPEEHKAMVEALDNFNNFVYNHRGNIRTPEAIQKRAEEKLSTKIDKTTKETALDRDENVKNKKKDA